MADSWVTTTNGAAWGDAFQPLKNQFLDYCRTLTSLDRQVGRVLAQIDRLGLGDGTLVVYAGSNGCFWGEHRLVDKRWAYEESIRIPMIVRYPAVIYDPGRRADQMVLNIDLAPTFLDAAGIPVPEAMEGRSLMPILRSEHAIGRSEFLYEYFLDFPYNVPPLAAIRTERHIYIEYRGRKGPELYDLDEDPAQRHNLIHTDSGRALADTLKPRLQALLRAETP
jgi:N-acetylglucosamine-6-sulfatase